MYLSKSIKDQLIKTLKDVTDEDLDEMLEVNKTTIIDLETNLSIEVMKVLAEESFIKADDIEKAKMISTKVIAGMNNMLNYGFRMGLQRSIAIIESSGAKNG